MPARVLGMGKVCVPHGGARLQKPRTRVLENFLEKIIYSSFLEMFSAPPFVLLNNNHCNLTMKLGMGGGGGATYGQGRG